MVACVIHKIHDLKFMCPFFPQRTATETHLLLQLTSVRQMDVSFSTSNPARPTTKPSTSGSTAYCSAFFSFTEPDRKKPPTKNGVFGGLWFLQSGNTIGSKMTSSCIAFPKGYKHACIEKETFGSLLSKLLLEPLSLALHKNSRRRCDWNSHLISDAGWQPSLKNPKKN